MRCSPVSRSLMVRDDINIRGTEEDQLLVAGLQTAPLPFSLWTAVGRNASDPIAPLRARVLTTQTTLTQIQLYRSADNDLIRMVLRLLSGYAETSIEEDFHETS